MLRKARVLIAIVRKVEVIKNTELEPSRYSNMSWVGQFEGTIQIAENDKALDHPDIEINRALALLVSKRASMILPMLGLNRAEIRIGKVKMPPSKKGSTASTIW